ncbi:dTDP-4-amino-4,6-dideoxygalactose transaminase [Tepidamorphus gemmatus]|uniref:dTDP-4-amino-4,6-dideoxygalactose transaminase n=1 Tax=Tepidamorphus gemmatus TaxID=747076 RepID=A0A4R3MJA1_9HYPH|nr:DegT/DnrJ/EryC1/StrS family aminotransferase [Tepidamorphus gemmatus]TCT12622.1 dTDP-4-amino-4,6-dideoxygalactose transaminase [Tepidamorphus gemmatus]
MSGFVPVPFFRPSIGEEEIDEVVATLRSGWLTTGERARRFEAAFSDYIGSGVEAIAVNSATAGLHLALEALGIGPGDEVIVPDLTFTATAEVVRYLGAEVRLVDVDPVTLCLTPEAFAAAVGPRTRAVIPVHYGGLACDLDGIAAVAAQYGIDVVEDAAHALPTRWRGRLIGSHGTAASVFSFYANKTITTGEGGMLVTPRRELAARAKVMRLHGIDRDAFDRYRHPGHGWRYDIVAPGFKYNLSDLAAAVGLRQLAKADALRDRREAIAGTYLEAFADLPLRLPVRGEQGGHAWHLFAVRLDPSAPIDRDGFIAALAERGIGSSMHYAPLHRMTYWRERYGLAAEDYPVSEEAFRSLVTLPLFPDMRDEEIQSVIAAVREALDGRG